MAKMKKGEKQVNIELPIELWAMFDEACSMFKKKQAVGAALYHFIKCSQTERFELVHKYMHDNA